MQEKREKLRNVLILPTWEYEAGYSPGWQFPIELLVEFLDKSWSVKKTAPPNSRCEGPAFMKDKISGLIFFS